MLAHAPRKSGIAADRWSPARVARLLRKSWGIRWTPPYAIRRLRRAGILVSFAHAREPRLSLARRRTLQRLLRKKPVEVGLCGDTWSRRRVVEIIERRFRVRYTRQHAGRLIRALDRGITLARAERRLTPEQAQEVRCAMALTPHQVAVSDNPDAAWTRALVLSFIARRFRIHYSVHSLRRALKRWDITLRLAPGSRPRRLNPQQADELRRALARLPREEGLEGNVWTQPQIAQWIRQRFGLSYHARNVHRMLARWHIRPAHGTAGGRPCALNKVQLAELAALLGKTPAEAGYPHPRWNRALVAQIIRERFQITYRAHSLSRVLRRQGLRLSVRRAPPVAVNTNGPATEASSTPPPRSDEP
jgi:transposase